MKKIFYLLPMLLIGLAFFACDDEEDDDGAANTFENPRKIGKDEVVYGLLVTDKVKDDITANLKYFSQAGKSSKTGDDFDNAQALDLSEKPVLAGKVVTEALKGEALNLKKDEVVYFDLKKAAPKLKASSTGIGLSKDGTALKKDADIDNDDEFTVAVTATVADVVAMITAKDSDATTFPTALVPTIDHVDGTTSADISDITVTSIATIPHGKGIVLTYTDHTGEKVSVTVTGFDPLVAPLEAIAAKSNAEKASALGIDSTRLGGKGSEDSALDENAIAAALNNVTGINGIVAGDVTKITKPSSTGDHTTTIVVKGVTITVDYSTDE